MNVWKLTIVGASFAAATCLADYTPANVTVTGERGGSTPAPDVNLPNDLRSLTAHDGVFVRPVYANVGEVSIGKPFDGRDRAGNLITPDLLVPCTPVFFPSCDTSGTGLYGGNASVVLRNMNLSGEKFRSARAEALRIYDEETGENAFASDHSENQRRSMKAPRMDDFTFFAGNAAL